MKKNEDTENELIFKLYEDIIEDHSHKLSIDI
jgi:hypothetical protein